MLPCPWMIHDGRKYLEQYKTTQNYLVLNSDVIILESHFKLKLDQIPNFVHVTYENVALFGL